MNNPALTEDVKTAPPSPKLNRRKRPYGRPLLGRLALRFAALVVAVSALGAAYWFTRPPELVWWTSDPIKGFDHRLRLLIPNGWIPQTDIVRPFRDDVVATVAFQFEPHDQR